MHQGLLRLAEARRLRVATAVQTPHLAHAAPCQGHASVAAAPHLSLLRSRQSSPPPASKWLRCIATSGVAGHPLADVALRGQKAKRNQCLSSDHASQGRRPQGSMALRIPTYRSLRHCSRCKRSCICTEPDRMGCTRHSRVAHRHLCWDQGEWRRSSKEVTHRHLAARCQCSSAGKLAACAVTTRWRLALRSHLAYSLQSFRA